MRQEGKDTDKDVPSKGATDKHSALVRLSSLLSALRARLGAQQQPIESSTFVHLDDLYEAIWDRIERAVGSAIVSRETTNWSEYFDGLHNLIHKTVAESSTCSLSEGEKADLVRRLEDSLSQLQNELQRVLNE